jgi:catechol 2,3-dioxygenase-like lactoylglutathione lyase family enzyme
MRSAPGYVIAVGTPEPRGLGWRREVVLMLGSASAHGVIAVTDIDRAKKFYSETLGLDLLEERSSGLQYGAGGGTRFLVYPSQFSGASETTSMAFMVDDIHAAVKSLRDAGVTFEEYDLPGLKTADGIADAEGERGAWFKDPDGNILALGQEN